MSEIFKENTIEKHTILGTKPSKLLCFKSLLVLENSKEKSRSQYTSTMKVWMREQRDFKSWVSKKAKIVIIASYAT